MIYFFYGTDEEGAREAARALVAQLRKAQPDAELFPIDAEHFDPGRFDDLIGGRGLFYPAHIVHAAGLFEEEEIKEFFLVHLSALAASQNIFVCAEGRLDIATARTVGKAAEKIQEFKKKADAAAFNIFALADALAVRDKKNLWVLYQKAVRAGFAPENITGTLFWKVKTLLLGGSPSRLWSADELKTLSSKIVALYHDSHRGLHEFPIALERFILTI